jgi:hypothetical protein
VPSCAVRLRELEKGIISLSTVVAEMSVQSGVVLGVSRFALGINPQPVDAAGTDEEDDISELVEGLMALKGTNNELLDVMLDMVDEGVARYSDDEKLWDLYSSLLFAFLIV